MSLVVLACRAVLLDADGTLIMSDLANQRTWRAWAAERGLDPEPLVRSHGKRIEETVAPLVPPEELEAAVARVEELEVADVDGVAALPGVPAFLRGLGGGRWAIVTSATRALLLARLAAAGLDAPPVTVTADDVGSGKPHPEGYRLAAARLGVACTDCVVVEDSPAGVAAGLAAGATVLGVTTTHPHGELDGATVVVDDLAAVQATVAGDRILVELGDPPPGHRRDPASGDAAPARPTSRP